MKSILVSLKLFNLKSYLKLSWQEKSFDTVEGRRLVIICLPFILHLHLFVLCYARDSSHPLNCDSLCCVYGEEPNAGEAWHANCFNVPALDWPMQIYYHLLLKMDQTVLSENFKIRNCFTKCLSVTSFKYAWKKKQLLEKLKDWPIKTPN